MSIEQEIKLALPADQADEALAALTELAGMAPQEIILTNIYFDTPDETLCRAKCALRLRSASGRWLQTLKRGGSASNGFHQREEWETLLDDDKLDLGALLAACEDRRMHDLLRQVESELAPLFRTDFTRMLWSVDSGDAHVEVALDRGEVVAQGKDGALRAPISEIELELKHGSQASLRALAAKLRERLPGLSPDDVSKAQRGYALRNP